MAAPKNIDTRQLILDSTEKLIKERQVEAVSLQDIATEAGISKGTLYYYYTSKQLVLIDLVERYLKSLYHDLIIWVENKDKDTSLHRLLNYVMERGARSERAKLHIYLINHALETNNELVRKKFKDTYNEWSNLLLKKISERYPGEDAETLTDIVITLLDGIMIREMLGETRFDLMKIAEFLAGLRK
jgi:AcrR family transcriptional regulator